MRALIQRVKTGKVTVDGRTVAEITHGLVILLGIGHGDTEEQARFLAGKIASLRIFEDQDGKFNRSILDIGGRLSLSPSSPFTQTRATDAGFRSLKRLSPKLPHRSWINSLTCCASRVSQPEMASSAHTCWLRLKTTDR